jgi:hypothetical protein
LWVDDFADPFVARFPSVIANPGLMGSLPVRRNEVKTGPPKAESNLTFYVSPLSSRFSRLPARRNPALPDEDWPNFLQNNY